VIAGPAGSAGRACGSSQRWVIDDRRVDRGAWVLQTSPFECPILPPETHIPPPSRLIFQPARDAAQFDGQCADRGRHVPPALFFPCPCRSNYPGGVEVASLFQDVIPRRRIRAAMISLLRPLMWNKSPNSGSTLCSRDAPPLPTRENNLPRGWRPRCPRHGAVSLPDSQFCGKCLCNSHE
jgi:hypothetical protein